MHGLGSQLLRLVGGGVRFVELAAQDCDGVIAVTQRGFQFRDLGTCTAGCWSADGAGTNKMASPRRLTDPAGPLLRTFR